MNTTPSPEIQRGIDAQSLGIEVTTRCNSACTYCFVRAQCPRETDLSQGLVREILVEGHAAGYRRLQITGGEPFLWEGLLDLLCDAENIGYSDVLINTNGLLLNKSICRRLAEISSVRLTVSLQGGVALHERTRGIGTYWKTREHIATAIAAGLRVYIFTTVFNSFIDQLPTFAKEIDQAFPALRGHCFIQLIRVHRDRDNLSEELVGPDAFVDLVRKVALLRIFGLKVDILNNALASVAAAMLDLPWAAGSPPLSPPGRLMILADGAMTLNHSERKHLGAYSPGMISTVLASEAYIRTVAADREVCPECPFNRHCKNFDIKQPSDRFRDDHDGAYYCQRVLTAAAEQRAVA